MRRDPADESRWRGRCHALVAGVAALALAVDPSPAWSAGTGGEVASLGVGDHERLLVIAPHPDDETLGAGGLIQEVLTRGGTVSIVWVTAGDGYVEAVEHATGELRPRAVEFVAYGEQRIREARRAARTLAGARAGEATPATRVLGFPDGGLRALLRDHWRRTRPERSATTGADRPPYPESSDASRARYDGADLRRELDLEIGAADPTLIAFPDPADNHPDHHAVGIFTLLALDDWADTTPHREHGVPRMLAYLVHWPDWPPGWDAPPDASDLPRGLSLPQGLPERGLARVTLQLAPSEIERKQLALEAHATQQAVMPALLRSFVRADEPFTVFSPEVLEHLTASIERSIADFERARPSRVR